MDFGIAQIGLILLILVAVAMVISAVLKVRAVGPRVLLARGAGGLVLLVVAVLLLWFATVLQTYLGLTGEIKAAHAVVTPVDGADHQLEVDLTLSGDEDTPERRETFRVQGDLWVLQANIVELEPWVNAL
ncbi:hypothetical protein IU469_34375, partial [Nocardia puris]|nr:hypothetical protein [Nocardia puris]